MLCESKSGSKTVLDLATGQVSVDEKNSEHAINSRVISAELNARMSNLIKETKSNLEITRQLIILRKLKTNGEGKKLKNLIKTWREAFKMVIQDFLRELESRGCQQQQNDAFNNYYLDEKDGEQPRIASSQIDHDCEGDPVEELDDVSKAVGFAVQNLHFDPELMDFTDDEDSSNQEN